MDATSRPDYGDKAWPVPEGVLLGMGNPLLDITVYTDTSFLDKYHLLPNNAIMATEAHQHMFTEMVEEMNPFFIAGGATQNSIRVAQWLLQRPKATTFFGGVGEDPFRHILEEKAAEVGVKVKYQVHQGRRTGVCGAIITGEDRSLVSELGAARHFTKEYLHQGHNWDYVEKAQYYYIGGFIFPVSPEAVLSIARHCARHSKTLVMNLHATFLAKHFADPKLAVMQYIDILFGNGDEAAEFAKQAELGTTDIKDIALKTAALPKANPDHPRMVIFTRGKDSTIVAREGKVTEIPVVPIPKELIKDTNGCGDAFVGGFLSQLAQGRSLEDCLRCGSYAAKVVIQNYGCTFPPKPDFS
jgi:adenosine kinase